MYWHIADSQSFPLQVKAFPELAEKGAYSNDEFYSENDVREINQYANEVSHPSDYGFPGQPQLRLCMLPAWDRCRDGKRGYF